MPSSSRPEDHLGARVEAGDPRVRMGLEQATRRLSGADSEIEGVARRERHRSDRGLLEGVEVRDLGPHHLQVGIGIPVELSAHATLGD